MTHYKKHDIDILIGKTISRFDYSPDLVSFTCTDETRYEVQLEDDGCGGNDSHAFFAGCDLIPILGEPIVDAWHDGESSYGVSLVLKTAKTNGFFTIIHEHNGYYDFSYDVVLISP